MKIGVDISSLQGPHRMRGIGYTASNFISHLPKTSEDKYVFYLKETDDDISDITELISTERDGYELRFFQSSAEKQSASRLLRPYMKVVRKLQTLSVYRSGDRKYPGLHDIDYFIQLDQSQPLPKLRPGARNAFIAYDLIPYLMEADYLHSYRTSRKLGKSRRASLKASVDRYVYLKKVKLNIKRADKIMAISQTTKRDFMRLADAPNEKIIVITLGVATNDSAISKESSRHIKRYEKTSWGYLPYESSLKSGSFLLFVGGADSRRRLQDLVSAFNHLRGRGQDIKLVLSGDIMQGPRNIPNRIVQNSLLTSSYSNDIYYLGFTDDETRDWLYAHALAFVFPSVYEGFGLPVLEAMGMGTPVVCYRNGAVEELTDDIPFFATDTSSLIDAITEVRRVDEKQLKKLRADSIAQAKKYTWNTTVQQILRSVGAKR